MKKEQEALAVIVGEAWAQRMADKQLTEGATIGGQWPGRSEDVATLAKPLSDKASELKILGRVILTNAQRAWRGLTRQPAPSDASSKTRKTKR